MNKFTIFAFFLIICISNKLSAQQSSRQLFIEAATQLYNETQPDKKKYKDQYDASEVKISKYLKERPKVSVFGGTPEQNKKLEDAVNEIVFEDTEIAVDEVIPAPPPPPLPPKEKRKKSDQTSTKIVDNNKEGTTEKISFTTTPMFPSEPRGLEILSATNPKVANKPKEKIKWVEGPTVTHTETIYIDDIKDPVEKQKMKDYGEHSQNVFELNKIGFIEAIYNASKEEAEYSKMMVEVQKQGFDFKSHFRKASILDKADQVPFIKAKILSMIEKVLTR